METPPTTLPATKSTIPTALQELDAQVKALTITTPETATFAKELWKQGDAYAKKVKADLDETIKDAKAFIKTETEKANVLLTLCANNVSTLKTGLIAYQERADAEARKEQDRLNAEYQKKIEKEEKKAEAKGLPVRPVAPPPIVQAPAKSEAGVSFVELTTWDCLPVVIAGKVQPGADLSRANTDLKEITDYYFTKPMLDTTLIGTLVKAGKGGAISGITVRKVKTLANKG
jgi:hypothetical protein